MIPYTVVHSKRRTLSIEVSRAGEVIVRAPMKLSTAKINAAVSAREAWINDAIMRQKSRADAYPPLTDTEIDELYRRASVEIPPLVDSYAHMMGVVPSGVRINRAMKRFGSCSAKNSINISCMTLRYPADAVHYVIVHELAHIRYHNHSRDFYNFVGHFLPDYREREKMLK